MRAAVDLLRTLLHQRPGVLCASPKYLEKYGTPERVVDLTEHRCIIHRQNDDAYGVWRYIVNDHTEAIKVKGALSSNDGDIVLRWALDGHGILIRSEWDLAKYVQSGRLNLVLPNRSKAPVNELKARIDP